MFPTILNISRETLTMKRRISSAAAIKLLIFYRSKLIRPKIQYWYEKIRCRLPWNTKFWNGALTCLSRILLTVRRSIDIFKKMFIIFQLTKLQNEETLRQEFASLRFLITEKEQQMWSDLKQVQYYNFLNSW